MELDSEQSDCHSSAFALDSTLFPIATDSYRSLVAVDSTLSPVASDDYRSAFVLESNDWSHTMATILRFVTLYM